MLLSVLSGAIAVLGAAWLAGRTIAPQLTPCISFGMGAMAVSYAVFALMLLNLASMPMLTGVLALSAAPALWHRPALPVRSLPLPWLIVLVPFGAWYLINSLAPEIQADPNVYHLQPSLDSLRFGGFSKIISFYDRLPHAVELLFVPAWRIGGSSSAKLVHLGFLVATLPVIVHLARLLDLSRYVGLAAAALYFCTPIVGFAGVAAFNDAALVYFTLAALAAALEDRPWHAGLLAGFCYAVKMTGLLAVPVVMAFFLSRRQWRRAAYVAIAATLPCLPWLVRNLVQTGNPLAPFMNAWFPNPYFYVLTEEQLIRNLRDYGVPFLDRFYQVLAGSRLHGIVGPVFVLAPLALLAFRRRNGAVLLALTAVFSIPWWMNAGARFTMTPLPFLALAMCAAIPPRAAVALVAVHAVTAWPTTIGLYSPGTLRLADFPLSAALRIESEQAYLTRTSFDYRYAKMVERGTPENARILDLWGMHTVYSGREFIGSWRSAEAVRMVEGLEFARPRGGPPLVTFGGVFPAKPICGVRAALAAGLEGPWTVHGIEVLHGTARVTNRSRAWLSASKMRWETPLALDRNLVSRWSTGQAGEQGDSIQVEFERSPVADSVQVQVPAVTHMPSIRIEVCEAGGWKQVDSLRLTALDLNLRPAAVQLLKQAGITHLVVPAGFEGMGVLGERLVNTAGDWGLDVVSNLDAAYLLKVR